MRPSPLDLQRLRRHPQRTKVYLGIYKPEIALACQVNDPDITMGQQAISYNNVTEGNYNLVISGMTIYVGSNPGGKDRGRLRVKSASAASISVAENDDIQWADDLYLTIVRFFEPWGVYPRIVLDAQNIPTWYKDYDIAYTNQNEVFDPVPHMGPHFAGFRETGTITLDYSSSGTFDPTDDSTPTGTSWWFEGGVPTGSGDAHPSTIQYTNSGHFTTHLEVTSDQGKTFTGHRHIMVFDRPGQGDNPPIIGWGLIGLEGNRGAMGYTARMFVREKADCNKVVDGALVVLFTEDWYGDEKVSIGGNAYDRSNILFAGYIEGESIRYNSHSSRLEFRVSSIAVAANSRSTYSTIVEDTEDPMYWYEMSDTTIDRAVVHFLRWHTTLLSIADFEWTGDSTLAQKVDFGRGTISSEIDTLYENALGANLVTDRQGKMWAEIDINLTVTGSRNVFAENMELERQDWLGEFNFDREFMRRVSYLEAGGIAYSGVSVTGTWEPLLAGAPGEASSYEGTVIRRTGLALMGQFQLNQFAGLDFARHNMDYPRIDITLAGDYRTIDIAPQEFVLLSLAEADTYRNIVWQGKRFIPQGISISYDPQKEILQYNLTVAEETWAPSGTTVEIPIEPPYFDPDVPEWEDPWLPPIEIPPITLPPIPIPPATGNLVYYSFANKIARCRNFWGDSPNWEPVGFSGTFGGEAGLTQILLDPSDPLNTGYLLKGQGGYCYIYRTNNLNSTNPTWAEIWGATETALHLDLAQGKIYEIVAAPANPGELWIVATKAELGAGTWKVFVSYDYGGSWNTTGATGLANAGSGSIIVSAYRAGLVWFTTDKYIMRTFNAGGNWNQLADDDPDNVFNPYFIEETATSITHLLAVAASDSSSWSNGIFYTADSWQHYTEISPDVGTDHPWGPRNDEFGGTKVHFISHPINANWYSMMQHRNYGVDGFWHRAGIGGNWSLRHQFLSVIPSFSWNIADAAKFYAWGNSQDQYLLGSSDQGFTWANRIGDFASQVANPVTLSSKNIQVVHVV